MKMTFIYSFIFETRHAIEPLLGSGHRVEVVVEVWWWWLTTCTWWRKAEQREGYCTNWHGASSPSRPGCPGSPFSPLNPRKPCLQRWPRGVTGREVDDLWPLCPSSTMDVGDAPVGRGGASPIVDQQPKDCVGMFKVGIKVFNQWPWLFLFFFVLVGISLTTGSSSSSTALSDLEGHFTVHS